jgi:hypothetical protein
MLRVRDDTEDRMDAGPPTPPPTAPTTALIDRLLAEAEALGEEAREQLQTTHGETGLGSLHAQHEFGIVATCLGYSVAWLLDQKAVAAGEIAAAARPELAETLASEPPTPDRVHPAVISLGRRVRAFGRRIERLAA